MRRIILFGLALRLLSSPAQAADAKTSTIDELLAAADGATGRLTECAGKLAPGLETAEAAKCPSTLHYLSKAFAAHHPGLDLLSCSYPEHLDKPELTRYWRCMSAATDQPGSGFCAWLKERTEKNGVSKDCLDYGRASCAGTADQAHGDFARLGRALIEKNAQAAELCPRLFGSKSAAGCARLVAGDIRGACGSPGFSVTTSDEPAMCPTAVNVLLGRGDCDSLRKPSGQDAADATVDVCRELILFRKARAARDAGVCGDSSESIVCRALMTRDMKACAPAASALVAAACKAQSAAPWLSCRAVYARMHENAAAARKQLAAAGKTVGKSHELRRAKLAKLEARLKSFHEALRASRPANVAPLADIGL